MLTIWTDKIKHSTVGSSFSVTFSVAPNELEYLNKLYDCLNSMNMTSFHITADRKTEPIPHDDYIESRNDYLEAKACYENHWEGCKYEPIGYEVTAVVGTMKTEPQTERSE